MIDCAIAARMIIAFLKLCLQLLRMWMQKLHASHRTMKFIRSFRSTYVAIRSQDVVLRQKRSINGAG